MKDMARVTEIALDHYSISIYVPEFNLRFNDFLIKDEEPLLFHTGIKQMFPFVREGIARVLDPATLRWISFSHFEADECGGVKRMTGRGSTRGTGVRIDKCTRQCERFHLSSGPRGHA